MAIINNAGFRHFTVSCFDYIQSVFLHAFEVTQHMF